MDGLVYMESMSKRVPFTQADITRLLKGAQAAGVAVRRVGIDRVTGNLVADFVGTGENAPTSIEDEDDDGWGRAISDRRQRRLAAQRH